MQMANKIACGIAGWSYPDWEGYVYPSGKIKSSFDRLQFIALYVDVIEINNTFYRPPDRKSVESWLRRVKDYSDFFFTAKLHQSITHQYTIEPGVVKAIRDSFQPMVEAGKLKHLLAQFKYDYVDCLKHREYLQKVCDNFQNFVNLTFELRHNSWQSPGAIEFLNSLGISLANIDCPLSRTSFNLKVSPVGKHAYFRLHGRNRTAWFNPKAGRDEVYNYLYSTKEIDEIVQRISEIAARSESLTVIANNHYQGKEIVNALQIKAMITGRKVLVPDTLLQKYPVLKQIALC